MSNKIYLPIASGMLRAYAESLPKIRQNYVFQPFIFIRQEAEIILRQYRNPAVLAFSSSLWNHQLNLHLAKIAKQMYPKALVVFGGPQVPQTAAQTATFLQEHPFVDIVVRGEGEETFAEILLAHAQNHGFYQVKGLGFIDQTNGQYIQTPDRPLLENINLLLSPYLLGLFDYLVDDRHSTEYQVILETNRGCPFGCSFCFWGNATRQIRKFDLARVQAEINWLSQHQIEFVYGADANFGMLKRDLAIANMFVLAKQATGYPKAFRVCYGKNAEDNIFTIAQLLAKEGLARGVTLSFQSTNPTTLANIGRHNINLATYRHLQTRYHRAHIPVYTELILGLPSETYTSFIAGIEEVLQAGLHDQMGIFFCVALPNTDMTDPEYASQHGITTQRLLLTEPHASIRSDTIPEYEDIVVATSSLPLADWKKAATVAWLTQVLHGFKLGFFLSLYLHKQLSLDFTKFYEYILSQCQSNSQYPILSAEIKFYQTHLESILAGQAQCVFLPEFGDISWQNEEATLLRLSDKLANFYLELSTLVEKFMLTNGFNVTADFLAELIRFQYLKISSYLPKPNSSIFCYNLPEFFDHLLQDKYVEIKRLDQQRQILNLPANNFNGNRLEYARQIIWYGRRDSRILEPTSWQVIDTPD